MKYIVDGQRIYPYQKERTIADESIDFVNIEFEFSSEWDGMQGVTTQFTQDGKTYNKLLKDGKCTLPTEIHEGSVVISVFGYRGAVRGTTAKFPERICESGFVPDGETPVPPTPDLYAQLLAEIRSKKTAYEAAVAGGYTGTEEEFNDSMAAVAGISALDLLHAMQETGIIDPVADSDGALFLDKEGNIFIL